MVVSMIEVNYNRRQDCWNNVHKGGYTFFIFLFVPIFWNSNDYLEWKRHSVNQMNAMHGSIRLELGTMLFASEKGSLQCVFEGSWRHRLRSPFNAGIIILFNFCRLALIFSETNRPFGEVGHVLEYHLATAREMVRHPSVHYYHKALSAIARSLPRVIQR